MSEYRLMINPLVGASINCAENAAPSFSQPDPTAAAVLSGSPIFGAGPATVFGTSGAGQLVEQSVEIAPTAGESDAGLSGRERRVLALFADGMKAQLVASTLGLSESTVDDYLRRIRAKYAKVGRPANTKIDLYKRALEDGILPYPKRIRAGS
jgi:DNA-binding CsgD family transcriptional regulator